MSKSFLDRYFYLLLLIVIAINATCFFTGILEGDSVLYATIAKRMAQSNDWMNLYADGKDWLDKPHFPFWAAALSFKLFGFSSFAYKLPGFIFWCISLWYTYKVGAILYNKQVAKMATLIFGSSLHVVLANFDLRAESYLTAFIIAAAYFMLRAYLEKDLKWFAGLAIASAGAIMTKGLFAGITIGSGLFLYLLFTRQLAQLLNIKWLICLLLVVLFITPELYAVYTQFDLHPEKLVYGRTGVSGIKFFLWDSQFGRFLNTGPIKGKGDPSFFVHTTLWAFLPWSFLLVAGIWQIIKKRLFNSVSLILTGSALVTFIMFSFSKFQLPHYIVIIAPHLSIITAFYIYSLKEQVTLQRWNISMSVLIVIVCFGVTALSFYSQLGNSLFALVPVWLICIASLFTFKNTDAGKLTAKGIAFSAALFWFLNLFFYPPLMRYQAGTAAGLQISKLGKSSPAFMYGENNESFELYSPVPVVYNSINIDRQIAATMQPVTVFTSAGYLQQLTNTGYQYAITDSFESYRITKLKAAFLNVHTRPQTTGKGYLLTIYQKP